MQDNPVIQLLQALFGAPRMAAPSAGGPVTAAAPGNTATQTTGTATTDDRRGLGYLSSLFGDTGRREYLKNWEQFDSDKLKADKDKKPGDEEEETVLLPWQQDVENVRKLGPGGLSDAMKANIGYGTVTPGYRSTRNLDASGMHRFMDGTIQPNWRPKEKTVDLGRPDDTDLLPPRTKPSKPLSGTGMTGALAELSKLMGG